MPATFAHPAFAWPLRHLRLSKTALTIGAVVPDIAHLLPRRAWTDHTPLSVLTFSLPLGLVFFFAWSKWVAPGLAAWAPPTWRAAFEAELSRPRPVLRVFAAVVLGAATHVFIDHFTHGYGGPVRALPGLFLAPAIPTPWGYAPFFKLLQYVGSAFGTAFLALAMVRWVRRHGLGGPDRATLTLLITVGAIAAGGGFWRGWQESHWLRMPDRLKVLVAEGLAGTMVCLAVEALVLGTLGLLMAARLGRSRAE